MADKSKILSTASHPAFPQVNEEGWPGISKLDFFAMNFMSAMIEAGPFKIDYQQASKDAINAAKILIDKLDELKNNE